VKIIIAADSAQYYAAVMAIIATYKEKYVKNVTNVYEHV
jgi:hypothetical protein